jgi:hypothetical protein
MSKKPVFAPETTTPGLDVKDVIATAEKAAKRAANEAKLAKISAVEKDYTSEAEKLFTGPVQYVIGGATWKVDRDHAIASYVLQGRAQAVMAKWRDTEMYYSEKFNAPACYSEKKADSYKALTHFLESTSPNYRNATATIEHGEKQLKPGMPGLDEKASAEYYGAIAARNAAVKVIGDIRRMLREHFETRTKKAESDGDTKAGPKWDDALDGILKTVKKWSENKDAPILDKTQAGLIRSAIGWVKRDPRGFSDHLMQYQRDTILGAKTADKASNTLFNIAALSQSAEPKE